MSAKPEQTRGAKHANHHRKSYCKRTAKRLRRRLEKRLLDDTPKSVIRGWAD